MDANLQRMYQLAQARDFAIAAGTRVTWDAKARVLRLAGVRAPNWTEDVLDGAARRALPPGALDRFGTRARIEEQEEPEPTWRVVASGAIAGDVELVPAGAEQITDAIISDDVLYLAIGGRVMLRDLRGRWDPATVDVPGGRAWRLATSTNGVHVAVVDDSGDVVRLGEVVGRPSRRTPHRHAPSVFRPRPEDSDPPRYIDHGASPASDVAAIATSPSGRLALLAWETAGDAQLFVKDDDGWSAGRTLSGARRPYSLAWLDDARVAVLLALPAQGTFAAVYEAEGAPVASPVGELFPLASPAPAPFLHSPDGPPHYLSRRDEGEEARPLLPLSWPSYATRGSVDAAAPLDGLARGVIWHRLYLEAAIPAGASVTVWLAASEELVPPSDADWFPHRFGAATPTSRAPLGTWVPAPSEIPFHEGLLGCPPRPGIAGLFTALIQRDGRRVRTLVGRYLWVRLELTSDGRATPEIAALRAYAGRRGYAALYLPELYRENVFGSDADAIDAATPADFLDRFLGLFESVLTPLEGRIANAWLLTHPKTTRDSAIEWLASWLGFVFAADLPIERRRAMLESAWRLYRRRGTLPGLSLALDLASNGGVRRGDIVVVEDFRLRRTFATILGADLTVSDDPLLPGLAVSGNSVVGETLILGEEDQRSFLALFAPELVLGDGQSETRDEAAITELFDRLAYRVTVLVHQEVTEHDLGLLRQVIALEAPAHVQVKVVTATERFRVAVSALVGVDTYLAPAPATHPVVLDRTRVGVSDVIERLPSLDPRLGRLS